eukprot:TRINITY_DN29956_c0_g1_i2.p1 TRINITY_DN29956_c0_g1~~TRINITY_DN29956_c0_g1_i2.p1  ORF type:complete len:771 (+),score=178.21 TRINITY_DN29956_c0_g1_i2:126-2438(+)
MRDCLSGLLGGGRHAARPGGREALEAALPGRSLTAVETTFLGSVGGLRAIEQLVAALLADAADPPKAQALVADVERVVAAANATRSPKQSSSNLLTVPGTSEAALCSRNESMSSMNSLVPPWKNSELEGLFWQRLNGVGRFATGATLRVMRKDALTKRWVCFMAEAKTGGSKPRQYEDGKARKEPRAHEQPNHLDKCPFCPGKEEDTEVLRVWSDGTLEETEGAPKDEAKRKQWLVRVVRNAFPYLVTPSDLYSLAFPGEKHKHLACHGVHDNLTVYPDFDHPLYQSVDGVGASEVVIESPAHNALIGISSDEQVWHGLRALAARGRTLRRNAKVHQLIYFKQYGSTAGGSLVHPHMQICSLPIVSGYMKQKLRQQRKFYEAHGCSAIQKLYVEDVIGGHVLAVSRLLQQTEHFVASVPFAQVAKGRIVIAPKQRRVRFEDCTDEELRDLAALLRSLMAGIYRLRDDPHYNLFWESGPAEHAFADEPEQLEAMERTFSWSLHVRVPPSVSGFGLASGVEVTKTLPEEEAKSLRGALIQEASYPLRAELFAEVNRSISERIGFPSCLGPFMMIQVDMARAVAEFYAERGLRKPDPASDANSMAGIAHSALHLPEGPDIMFAISPVFRITLSARERAAACIPSRSEYFAWSYSGGADEAYGSLGGSERSFLENGGYVYFDENMDVVGTTTVSPCSNGTGLIFERPQDVSEADLRQIKSLGRFSDVKLEDYKSQGALQVAWVRPQEFFGSAVKHGAFVFTFEDNSARLFALKQ